MRLIIKHGKLVKHYRPTLHLYLWYRTVSSFTASSYLDYVIPCLRHGEVDVMPASGVEFPIALPFLPKQNLKSKEDKVWTYQQETATAIYTVLDQVVAWTNLAYCKKKHSSWVRNWYKRSKSTDTLVLIVVFDTAIPTFCRYMYILSVIKNVNSLFFHHST